MLWNTDFSDAIVTGAGFGETTGGGFTKEKLYSTASYQAKDLRGIRLEQNDLTGWNFSGQNLSNAALEGAVLTRADLTGADTRGAQGLNLTAAISRNAILPGGNVAGLELATSESLYIRDDDGVPNWLPNGRAPRSPIAVTIQDRMTLADGSALQLIVEADAWDSLISFEPQIPVQLGGILDLRFAHDVDLTSQVGRTLRLFNWTGVTPSGRFEVRSQYVWDLSNLYTTGEVTLTAVPEPSASSLLVGVLASAACCQRSWGRVRLSLFTSASARRTY
jgi:uncharacterized protein YjbI with pentapeptide repeats